jgi:hypothetical protein
MAVYETALSYGNAIMFSCSSVVKWKYDHMSPKPQHIPKGARATSLSLTVGERAALNWVKLVRENRGDNRKTLNDILVDGLWLLAEKEGKTREEILLMSPAPLPEQTFQDNVMEMRKKRTR